MRKTKDGERVGEKMHAAVRIVAREPQQSKNQLATTVGPHGSTRYGYEIVNRALSKGLIELDREHPAAEHRGIGAVVITDKGRRYLSDQEKNENEN